MFSYFMFSTYRLELYIYIYIYLTVQVYANNEVSH